MQLSLQLNRLMKSSTWLNMPGLLPQVVQAQSGGLMHQPVVHLMFSIHVENIFL